MFKLFADSCCDFHNDNNLFKDVERVPLHITVNNNDYVDDKNIDIQKLLSDIDLDINTAKTACPSPWEYLSAMEKQDADEMFIVTLSSKLSGSYNSAALAARMFMEDNPFKKVHVFDSKSAAAGELVIINQIYELINQNEKFSSIVTKIENLINSENKLYFVLENLETLRKNGRLSKIQEIITSLAKIKLILQSDNGEIAVSGRALSMKQAIISIVKRLSNIDLHNKTIFITECESRKLADDLKRRILSLCNVKGVEIFKASGLSSVYENKGGIVIAY